jgi:DNA-binding SARP family transcriptional activator/tetratricopeptide (TPR) repeat protein
MTLKIRLLGQFNLQADELSMELPSRPAQSLLAYLALNAGVAHRREKLASLLWPDSSESNARSYLRQALWRIRKSFESSVLHWEDYLKIRDISVTFNEQSEYWLDADILLKSTQTQSVKQIIETVRLYQGELLPGFYDEWVLSERDRVQAAYHQKMHQLLTLLCESERWQEVLDWGEQWIRLSHSPEGAFRALMRAYAGMGDQGMVSATYQRCIDALDRELSLDPSPETRLLYEKIIGEELPVYEDPRLSLAEFANQQPCFLDDDEPEKFEKSVFVAREHELTQLDEFLKLAITGKGGVVFITGEAGSGKSSLIHEFTLRAQERHPNLIIASGNCNAHTGIGDPYLPFREILGLLTGDVESRWAGGMITKDHARRLWNILPLTTKALIRTGPRLINTFIPGADLMMRAMTYAPDGADWLIHLREVEKDTAPSPMIRNPLQIDLFEQYTRVLRALSHEHALVLVLDDLQWADAGSIGLLFHLGRQLAGSPILILGAYRQEEVSLGREGERHPLEPVVNEFHREFGSITVNLGQVDRREFVEKLLDSEPNRLGSSFREMLHQQTDGHALFTIELLRGMQQRGDLILDEDGNWIEGSKLDWETMPARVEAVIAERIGRLAFPLQRALRVASVEGEVFRAEVLAEVMKIDDEDLLSSLSNQLDRQHRLVQADRIQRVNGKLLSSYRFRHILFQKFLYSSLDEVQRVHLHEQFGTVLEELYSTQEKIPAIALQLARHFEEAGITEKTIYYLHQAGENAIYLSANQEGIAHLNRGLELLHLLPDSSQRAQQELSLQLSSIKARKCLGPTPEAREVIIRVRNLCQQLGEIEKLSLVLGELSTYHYVRAEYQSAFEFASEALSLAQQAKDPILEMEGHWLLGFNQFCLGDYTTAKNHLDQAISFYNPDQHHHSLVMLRGVDGGLSAMAYHACCLWCLGYPDQALRISQEVIALAKAFGNPFTLADILTYAGCMFHEMRRDELALQESAETLIKLVHDKDLQGWIGLATRYLGASLLMRRKLQEATEKITKGMEISQRSYEFLNKPISLWSLATAMAEAGQIESALETLTQAMNLMEQTGERHWETELHRLHAKLLIITGDESGAESNLLKAVEVSQKQQAKSWELRASIGLAKLWQKQGKLDEARSLLEPIYNWFTEGFDTADLIEAKALLEELS